MQYVAVLFLASMLLGACAEFEADSVDEPIVAGLDSGDHDVARHLGELLLSVRTVPTSGPMRGRLGMAYDINGLREAAIATYRQAESLDPADFRWPYFSAHLVAEDGDYGRALDHLDRAVAIDARYAPAWLWRGTWLLKSDRAVEALDAFRQAAAIHASPYARFGQAQALIALGEVPEAVGLLEGVAESFEHPYIRRTYGEALRAVGRLDDARTAMVAGRAAESLVWPDERRDERYVHIRGHASYMLAKELSAAGQTVDALAILRRLQAHYPEEHCGRDEEFFLACNLMNSVSIAHDRSGRSAESLATLERGLVLNPDFAAFHLTMAKLLRERRDLEGALGHVDRAIELSPNSGYSHEQRGRLLFGLDRHEAAVTAFETALALEPGKRTTLFYRGLAAVELSKYADAVGWFQRVTETEPRFALGHVFLARSLLEVGRLEEARRAQDLAREYGAAPRELRRNEVRIRELANESKDSG